ncbi:MAG TPA: hypothetical protein VMH87_07665 [Pseudomonadales bacterium]|nr:hypothetical protein [Pseudomonadales bacterium]
MKNFSYLGTTAILLSIFPLCEAQQVAQQQAAVPSATQPAIISRDANSRIWKSTSYELSPSGQTVPRLHQYTELASGLCYQQNDQWRDSQEMISILPDGSAEAIQGQHQVYFPVDIYNGVIKLITPDGLALQSQPLGLCYDDGTNTVLIAAITNSVGQLISPNQIIYPNAFAGIDADLLYTYTKAGLEQDVILEAQPPDPGYYGLNTQVARLQIITEFLNPPSPAITTTVEPSQAGISLLDDTINFGTMAMIPGRAFLLGQNGDDAQALIAKQWLSSQGRQFLIEEVPVRAIADQLSQLPQPSQIPVIQTSVPNGTSPLNVVSTKRLFPPQRLAKTKSPFPIRMSKRQFPKKGLLLDYQLVNGSQANFTFQGDMTYYISGPLTLSLQSTFEGGAVIKYTNGASITVSGSYIENASSYRPVIFTAQDDDTLGEPISGSTGNPTGHLYANPALVFLNSSPSISNFRIAYAQQAIELINGGGAAFYDGQIINCQNGFNIINGSLRFRNLLFGNVLTNFCNIYNTTLDIQNSTFSGSTNVSTIANASSQTVHLYFTNCIFANIVYLTNSFTSGGITYGTMGADNGFFNAPTFGADILQTNSSPFQAIGGGSYYLTSDCIFHDSGTANIDPALLLDLTGKTTYPPMVFSNTIISTNLTLSPQASRDTYAAIDFGYHYDPLDYVFGGCDLSSNLTITAGTAIGWFEGNGAQYGTIGNYYGMALNNWANLSFNGNATQPCYLGSFRMVQEAGNGNWPNIGWSLGLVYNSSSTSQEASISANFMKSTAVYGVNTLQDRWHDGLGTFNNCEFYTGTLTSFSEQSLDFTNCLFFRVPIAFWDSSYDLSFTFENCTFFNGGLLMDRGSSYFSFWQIQNCSFDDTAMYWSDGRGGASGYTLFDYNAYNTNNAAWRNYYPLGTPRSNTLENVGSSDIMVTNYNWESTQFGSFYLPTNSFLTNSGSVTANLLGLYHFTTQTNQIPETNSIVDIGYHYVARGPNGNPLDNNGDGIPDYIEDANGNGLVDSGEIGWNIVGDPGLSVIITKPRNGSTIP